MHFRTDQNELMAALQRVMPAVPAKSTLPILSNILLRLESNTLRLVATDLEISVVTDLEVQGEKDGSISIPAKKLGDIIRELEGLEVSLEADDAYHVSIQAGEGQFQVPGISPQEFPSLPEFEPALKLQFTAEKLESMIRRTAFAVSKDELRPALTGVFMQIRDHELRTVATDGHRLVRIIDQDFHNEGEDQEIIIPTKALDMVRRNLPDEAEVELGIGNNQLLVQLPEATLFSRLIEGRYPHYETVIPKENNNRLIVGRDALEKAVRRVQIFANPINKQIVFNISGTELTITSEDVELGGKGQQSLDVQYDGEDVTIGYNAAYVLELLRQITTDMVRFELGGATQAGIVKPTEQREKEDFLMLIMPVRLS